jgi:hypothetical protein
MKKLPVRAAFFALPLQASGFEANEPQIVTDAVLASVGQNSTFMIPDSVIPGLR